MQQKLKSVFRRSSQLRSSSGSHEKLGNSSHEVEASPPRADRQRVSSDRRGRTSVDSSAAGSVYTGRSRPVSSIYDDTRQSQAPTRQTVASDFASPADPIGGAIAQDYKAYLPALSPVNDDHGDEYITLGGDGQHIAGQSIARHEENVADRNIARYTAPVSTLPSAQVHSRKQFAGNQSSRARLSPGLSGSHVGNGDNVTTNGSLIDGEHLQTKSSTPEQGLAKRSSFALKAACAQPELEPQKFSTLNGDNEESKVPQETHGAVKSHFGVRHATMDGTAHGEETVLARKLREDGVADLRNTVDTDGDIKWAPAVTHEVIKPHQHEIVQQKIYREIHNYEHFHRIQPVMMTEVLPPRHWIPNPNGEGLIEISADELPARTGDNRWWSICEHSSPYSQQTALAKHRTEPEIIEAGTFMTEQGFERKETIIIHPPMLADLTGYGGPVQAMHFDHKTGKSWMGELTTMDKLHELQQELERAPEVQAFKMEGLDKALPKLPSESARRNSTSMPHRKPVGGHSPSVHGSDAGRTRNVA
ncbi:hypothetical protein E8E12_009902 [Didymella heteroderae]|uniref:Uncharacterized protein n=1 Tax=Didymella heteroderae TaxID=1769908 RepID=A0A9P5C4C5_9PLEO|nr:hypothetical protein E8E12_009902 [Didymella heteroderae]